MLSSAEGLAEVKALAAKHRVHEDIVAAMMGNAVVMLTIPTETSRLSVRTLVDEFGTRWMVLAKHLNVPEATMVELIKDTTHEAAEHLKSLLKEVQQLRKENKES